MECKHLKLSGPCSRRCHNIGEYWDNYNDRKRKTVAQMIESATPNTVQTQPAGHNIRPADSTTSVSRDCDVHRSGPATLSSPSNSPATSDSHSHLLAFSEYLRRVHQHCLPFSFCLVRSHAQQPGCHRHLALTCSTTSAR